MAPTPSTASSRVLSASRSKRTSGRPKSSTSFLHSKPRPHSTAYTRSKHGRVAASSGNVSKDFIDLTHDDSDAEASPPRCAPPTLRTICSPSRSTTYAELLINSDTELTIRKGRKTSTPPVAGPTDAIPSRSLSPERRENDVLTAILRELDAAKRRIAKFESANHCELCKEIMWQPCM